jgi:hypothetical protein
MKGVEMESNEVTAIVELLTETLGGATATRNESERDGLFQFAVTLASMLTFDEMVLGATQAVQDMSDEDVQHWLHVEGIWIAEGTAHCPQVGEAGLTRRPVRSERKVLDKFKRSLRGMPRYVLKCSPRGESATLRSMRLGDEAS